MEDYGKLCPIDVRAALLSIQNNIIADLFNVAVKECDVLIVVLQEYTVEQTCNFTLGCCGIVGGYSSRDSHRSFFEEQVRYSIFSPPKYPLEAKGITFEFIDKLAQVRGVCHSEGKETALSNIGDLRCLYHSLALRSLVTVHGPTGRVGNTIYTVTCADQLHDHEQTMSATESEYKIYIEKYLKKVQQAIPGIDKEMILGYTGPKGEDRPCMQK
jgi:hypothetical protein